MRRQGFVGPDPSANGALVVVTVTVRQWSLDLAIAGMVPPFTQYVTQSTPVNLGDVMLLNWRLLIPDGHAGLTGCRISVSGVTIVPFGNPNNPYIVGNDSERVFPVNTEVDLGLTVDQINEDVLQHTHYMIFEYTPISAASNTPITTVGAVPIS
jgi:hypothetical protein